MSQLHKQLKGKSIQQQSGPNLVLQDKLGEGAFSIIMHTNDPKLIVKVISKESESAYNTYKKESQFYQKVGKNPHLIQCKESKELQFGKEGHFAILILENCQRGCLFDVLGYIPGMNLLEIQIIKIINDVAKGLNALHSKNLIHRDVKLENILLGQDGNYKLCDFGSVTSEYFSEVNHNNRDTISDDIEKNTTPQYRAPEQLDLYQNYYIGEKVDIFALGVVIFILCFQKPPFDSKLAAINTQYFIPDQHQFSQKLVKLLQFMFMADPKNRFSAKQILDYIQQEYPEMKNSQTGMLNSEIFKTGYGNQIKPSFLNKCKKYITRWTKKSEGWVVSALEENDQGPKQKYVRYLVVKAWQKREKVPKFFTIMRQQLGYHSENPIIILKIELLLHNYFKKAPPEALDKKNTKGQEILTLIKQKYGQPQQKRSHKFSSDFTNLLISQYATLLIEKFSIGQKLHGIFEGNFSLNPFFEKYKKNPSSVKAPISSKIIEQLLMFLKNLVAFQDQLTSQFSIWNLQLAIILQLIDEEYCLISVLVHLLHAFKQVTNYKNAKLEFDQDQYKKKISSYERCFAENFKIIHTFFLKCSSFKDSNKNSLSQVIPNLSLEVIEFLSSIPTFSQQKSDFQLSYYIGQEKSIYKLKIPQSYGFAAQQVDLEKMLIEKNHTVQAFQQQQQLQMQYPTKNEEKLENRSSVFIQNTKPQVSTNVPQQQQKQQQKKVQKKKGGQLLGESEDEYSDTEHKINQTSSNQNHHEEDFSSYDNNDKLYKLQMQKSPENSSDFATPLNGKKPKKPKNSQNKNLLDEEEDYHEDWGKKMNDNLSKQDSSASEQKIVDPLDNFKMQQSESKEEEEKAKQEIEKNELFWQFSHQSINKDYQAQEINPQTLREKVQSNNNFGHDFDQFNDIPMQVQKKDSHRTKSGQFEKPDPRKMNMDRQQSDHNDFNNLTWDVVNTNNSQTQQQQQQQQQQSQPQQKQQQQQQQPQKQELNLLDWSMPQQPANNITQSVPNNSNSFFQNNPQSQQQQPQSAANLQFQQFSNQSFQNNQSQQQQQQHNQQQNQVQQQINNQTFQQSHNNGNQINNNNIQQNNNNNFGGFLQQSGSSPNMKVNPGFNMSQNNGNNITQQFNQQQINNNNSSNVNAQFIPQFQNNQSPHNPHNPFILNLNQQGKQQLQHQPQQNFMQQSVPIPKNNFNNNLQMNKQMTQTVKQNQFQPQMNQENRITQSQQVPNQFFNNNNDQNNKNINNINNPQNQNNKIFNGQQQSFYQPQQQQQQQQFQQQPNKVGNHNNGQIMSNIVSSEQKQSIEKAKTMDNSQPRSASSLDKLDIKTFLKNEVSKSIHKEINADEWIIDIKDIRLTQQIGSGNSSRVYRGLFKGISVAIKKMEIQNMKASHFKEFQREIATLVKLKPQPNLVSLLGISQKEDEFFIIMEYCGGGTLFQLLHKNKQISLSWSQRKKMCQDIAKGMLYLHTLSTPIIHRDLKSLNLLLDQKVNGSKDQINLKIADFGLARTNDTDLMTGVLGTFHWMAPEILESKPYSIKADVYSFGVCVWEILSRETPYKNLPNPHSIMKYVTIDQGRPDLGSIPADAPQQLVQLMIQCWDQDPSKRPDFQTIINNLDGMNF